MEYEDKGFVIEASQLRGLPLPEWAEHEPELLHGDAFYLSAFSELSTCRPFGMSPGPIPWRDIVTFGEYHGLDRGLLDFFVRVIRRMDIEYLQWQGKKLKTHG